MPHRSRKSGTPPPSQQSGNCGLAIASLICGIISYLICGPGILLAVAAIICGHMARGRIRASDGKLGGDGMALAGLILGYLNIAATIIGFVLYAGLFAMRVSTG